jgi:4-amino-4-deoxy-L-arabinose transferase-like glycosyltransferase
MLDSPLALMTEPSLNAQKTSRPLATKIAWTALILATLYVCYFSHLDAIGFVGPDEPRYAWIARDMVETGDWVTPRLYGKPWFEKPVLFYWGAALSFKLFGVSEAAARLPSAVSALLATLAMAWLAWRLYGEETARWLLLLLPTSVGMIGFSHAAATDMPFSGMLTIAMVAAAVVLRLVPSSSSASSASSTPSASPASSPSPNTPWLALIAFGVFLGAAVLAKGPAAIILSGGAAFFWALFTRRWRDAFRLFHPAAIASFCLTALPWYILCARRNTDFLRIFIFEHNFQRYLTPEFQHIQPFWYFGPILLLALLPWTGMSLSSVSYLFRRTPLEMRLDRSSLFILLWGSFPVVFFSLSKSKLPGYILPAVPALILLTALAVAKGLEFGKVAKTHGFAVVALTPVLLIGTTSVSLHFLFKDRAPHTFVLASGLVALLGLNACLAFAYGRKNRAIMICGVLACLLFLEAGNQAALPWLDPQISPRAIARTMRRHPEAEGQILAFHLRRSAQYPLNFYFRREIVEWTTSSATPALVLVSPEGIIELRREKIPYQIIDGTCLDAILVLVGQPDHPKGTSPV